jgi:hypothetical protein
MQNKGEGVTEKQNGTHNFPLGLRLLGELVAAELLE